MSGNTVSTPFRFGAEMMGPLDGRSWADSARELEGLGYSSLFVPDHFDEGFGPIAAMATAAGATTSLKVAALVMACDYRHPAVLARELASIDQLSEGRLEVGLGAGYKRVDYEWSGITLDPPKVRVDRMIEYVTVLRGLFGAEPCTFDGDHYRITDLNGTPKPWRPEGPPILIGGGGPRVLRYAAAHADIVGVTASIHSGTIDTAAAQDGLAPSIDQKFEWVRQGAVDRARLPEFHAYVPIAEVTDDAAGVAEVLAGAFDATPDAILESPLTLIGTASSIVDQLQSARARWGYSYISIPGEKAAQLAPIVATLTGT
jgi:probable F420-dependent oxidoreductase